MIWTLRVVGDAHTLTADPLDDTDGMWVESYDPDANGGRGHVGTTRNRASARSFNTISAAMDFWRQPSTVAPIRPDGQPNRPLTAWSIMLERMEEETP